MILWAQIGVAALVVGMTVLVHLSGLATLLALLRSHRRVSSRMLAAFLNATVIVLAAFGLFVLHSIEIWASAGIYRFFDALPDFEQALYFSTSTYVTIGYGDVVLPRGYGFSVRSRERAG